MAHRNVLLIHESATLRMVLKKVLLAEMADIEMKEASKAIEVPIYLRKEKFDIVIAGNDIIDLCGIDIYKKMKNEAVNKDTPLILLTEHLTDKQTGELNAIGIDSIIPLPLNPGKIVQAIDSLVDRRKWRIHSRLNITGTRALIYNDSHRMESNVINLSQGGMLCDMDYAEWIPKLAQKTKLSIVFPPEFEDQEINLEGLCLRQTVKRWKTPEIPQSIRLGWKFCLPEKKNMAALVKIFEKADNELRLET
ncbi:MAG: response regulator [bacterium]|nr:response regulator [bacterium]